MSGLESPRVEIQENQRQSCLNELRILFCANPNYFQHLAVALASIIQNCVHSDIDVHLITCDRDAVAEGKLKDSIGWCGRVTLTIHHQTSERLNSLFVDRYITKECYLRLLAADVLPPELERVIYLDCDVVVLDDLTPLWQMDLDGKAVGAVPDYPRTPLVFAPGRLAAIGIPEDWTYVNSGVLLLDFNCWRRKRLSRRMFEFIERQGAALALYDQDAINAVLHDDIQLLDCRWNLQAKMYRSGRRAFPEEFAATVGARQRPAIMHYTGAEKPWLFRSRTFGKKEYFRYLRFTAWRDAQPRLHGILQRTEYWLDRRLSIIGIDYLQVLHKSARALPKMGELAKSLSAALLGAVAARLPGSTPRPSAR